MFTLIIKKSKSKNFDKALSCALSMGATYDGDFIKLTVNEDLHIYDSIFPLLKFNVTRWKGTKAYFKGKEVHPYKFMLQKHLSVKIAVSEVLTKIQRTKKISDEYIFYKRMGNVLFFKNDDFKFDVELKGKVLFEFLENYEIGDFLYFNLD